MKIKVSETSKERTLRRINLLKHLRSSDMVNIPANVSDSFMTGIDMHDVIEQLQYALSELGAMTDKPEEEEEEMKDLHQPDWDDPVACKLEELLTNNLLLVFDGAVQNIVESGYTENVAKLAVLRSGLFHSTKDAISNVVDGALSLLKRENECHKLKCCVFEGMQSLVEYTILEMIHVLREVRPALTVAEAMWCLLMNDLNLLNACGVQEDYSGQKEASAISRSEFESSDDSKKTGHDVQILSQSTVADDKSGVCKKTLSVNSKREMLRQRTFHFEKNYRGRMTKGALKTKVAAWGNYVAEKSLISQSASSNVVTFSKLTARAGTNSGSCSLSISCSKNMLPGGVSELHMDNKSKSQKGNSDIPKGVDFLAGIPFDGTLEKYTPRDSKDEALLVLVPHKQELEKEIQRWMEWANEKVMQAAQKIGKDKAELRRLKQENEEIEKLNKASTIGDSTVKRLSEMEHALSIHSGQIKVANSALDRVEEDNSVLRKKVKVAKQKALESSAKLQGALVVDQKSLRKSRSWDEEKGVFLEMHTNLKRQTAKLENQIIKAKERRDQLKVLWKHEEKEKTSATTVGDSLMRERKDNISSTKEEMKKMKKMGAAKSEELREKIKIVESGISELRYDSDKTKLAAVSEGYGKSLAGCKIKKMFEDSFEGEESVKVERECVMCMSDEISVVFLPCAHQVLCKGCSLLHQQRGMTDCPSCRTLIDIRISVRYRDT